MPNTRLVCGRDWDGNIQKIEDVMITGKGICSLVIRETDLDDKEIDSIVNLISNVTVEIIHLENCWARNTKRSATRLVTALGNCRDVRLSGSTFLSKFFLEPLIESATQLRKLCIREHLMVNQIEALSKGLVSNKLLHTLDLSRSCIDDFSCLAKGLQGACVEVLRLRSIGLRDRHLKELMKALESPSLASTVPSSMTLLESLDLSFNRLCNLKYIGKFLEKSDCNLTELLIGYQNLWQPSRNGRNIDISSITDALSKNKRLKILKLRRNELGNSDAILFATALAENNTLETLDLGENNISDKGVMALAEAARESRALKELNLKGNPFGISALYALLDVATKNHNIFFLGGNDENDSENSTTDKKEFILSQIRYQTALNRGGRKLFSHGYNENKRSGVAPLGLWPRVLERQTCADKLEGGVHESMRFDALYYLLREGSATLFSRQRPIAR